MWQQLVVIGVAFWVAGATCLGGAIFHGLRDVEGRIIFAHKRVNDTDTRLTGLAADTMATVGKIRGSIGVALASQGEVKGEMDHKVKILQSLLAERAEELQRELNIWEDQHRQLEEKTKKIGDDLYRHFSLNMKKAKGAKK